MIKRIQVSNFKSFENIDIKLDNFNLLIGANASGKSNFIEIFRFLRDITKHGLDNAISLQGDLEYLQNINIGHSKNLSFKLFLDDKCVLPIQIENYPLAIQGYEEIYEFDIQFNPDGTDFKISKDKITYNCNFSELKLKEVKDGEIPEKEIGSGKIIVANVDGEVKYDFEIPKGVPSTLKEHDFQSYFFRPFIDDKEFKFKLSYGQKEIPPKVLLIEHIFKFFPIVPPIDNFFQDISVFDFDPKLPRKAISFTGKTELEEDGSNLTIVLKNILKDKDKKKKFTSLIKDVLPFVTEVGVEKFADKYLFFKLTETYSDQDLPASLLSDGTINIIALIIAIYFENGMTVIEELERDIHPYLISRVIEMISDASKKKQIIITTHSPEALKYIDLENILLISRNKQGFSEISKPCEKEEVKLFLEDEIGIEDLYVQNLLGM
jgi:Predicted ATPase